MIELAENFRDQSAIAFIVDHREHAVDGVERLLGGPAHVDGSLVHRRPRRDGFLFDGPALWISAAIIVGGGTLLSMLGPTLVRRYMAQGSSSRQSAVLYAVLLAFVIIVVWKKFSDAEANVVREAGEPLSAVAGVRRL